VKDILETLIKLQEIDSDLHRYEQQRDALKSKLAQLTDLIGRMEKSIQEKRGKLSEVEAWYRDQQDAVNQDNERVNKLKNSLNSVSKTKEYLLRQREIEGLRKAKQAKEDELKKAEEALNDFKQNIAGDEERLEALRHDTAKEGGSSWDQVEAYNKRIAEIQVRKTALLPSLPERLRGQYERILKNRDGLAVVPVLKGSCGGCHVKIRPQIYNSMLQTVQIVNCQQCSRFVYIPADELAEVMNAVHEPFESEEY
jgi:predicted  nucleic acid-binding Zn-ribbon protein